MHITEKMNSYLWNAASELCLCNSVDRREKKQNIWGTSLVVQWDLHAGGIGLIPGQGNINKIPHATKCGQKMFLKKQVFHCQSSQQENFWTNCNNSSCKMYFNKGLSILWLVWVKFLMRMMVSKELGVNSLEGQDADVTSNERENGNGC